MTQPRLTALERVVNSLPPAARLQHHLSGMLTADPELYGRILDAPGFAYEFNQICKMAADSTTAPTAGIPTERCSECGGYL